MKSTQPPTGSPLKMSSRTDFKLPDGKTEVWIAANGTGHTVGSGHEILARWTSDGTQARVSPAMINEERVQFSPVLRLELQGTVVTDPCSAFAPSSSQGQEDLVLVWASIYALWLSPEHREEDLIAISANSARVGEYLRCTGLGLISPFPPTASAAAGAVEASKTVFWLTREAFWQGAGAPDSQSWLRSRPETSSFPGFNGTLGVFASQMGFTRRGNVCTVHPERPPKPAPGAEVYSRFIVELGQQLRIRHIDAANPAHFAAYTRWQNSDRVNRAWQERGPDAQHRAYLAAQLADAHSMSCVFEWDGELAGYTELGWAKEDGAACFFNSGAGLVVGEHDQNSHILVGEEHLRGGLRYRAVATSIKHCCFLRDPRTQQVIAEPRFDLSHVQIQDRFLPQERKRRIHLPHKTAMLFALQRNRFFQEAHFV